MKHKQIASLLGVAIALVMLCSFATGGTATIGAAPVNTMIMASEADSEEDFVANSARISSMDVVLGTDGRIEAIVSAVVDNPLLERLRGLDCYVTFGGVKRQMTDDTGFIGRIVSDFLITKRFYLTDVGVIENGAQLEAVAKWQARRYPWSSWANQADKIGQKIFNIVDDDADAPNVQIEFSNINGNPLNDGVDDPLQFFAWTVIDPSGVSTGVYFIHDGDYTSPILLTESNDNPLVGSYELPQEIGTWQVMIVATDRDNDRPGDTSTRIAYSDIVTVTDDDTTVDITDLSATATMADVTITFTDVDYSGIASVDSVSVDGVPVTFSTSVDGTAWTVSFPNAWILELGTHHVELVITDADNDLPNDAATASFDTTFTITGDMVVGWTDAKLDELKSIVLSATGWKNKNNQIPMINKIEAVIKMKEAGNYAAAIEKLTNDILPKLTGKWIEDSWGFEALIDQILAGLNVLVSSTPVIRA
jgi:hypothetical protein